VSIRRPLAIAPQWEDLLSRLSDGESIRGYFPHVPAAACRFELKVIFWIGKSIFARFSSDLLDRYLVL
jgi:hypothetical protein